MKPMQKVKGTTLPPSKWKLKLQRHLRKKFQSQTNLEQQVVVVLQQDDLLEKKGQNPMVVSK
jgi:hypothetical protein